MTEQEWLEAISPGGGVHYLCDSGLGTHRRKAGRRKLRLFACACARRIWDLIPPGPHRQAVEDGERLCEGIGKAKSSDELINLDVRGSGLSRVHAADAAAACIEKTIWWAASFGSQAAARAVAWARMEALATEDHRHYRQAEAEEELAQVALLRETFGNPFRLVKPDPAWLRWNDRTVPAMAQAIYEERAFDRLPVLADALTDAGCEDEAILSHCRSEGPHQRGCWAVDLLLGR
jgi:hypothetical protein